MLICEGPRFGCKVTVGAQQRARKRAEAHSGLAAPSLPDAWQSSCPLPPTEGGGAGAARGCVSAGAG